MEQNKREISAMTKERKKIKISPVEDEKNIIGAAMKKKREKDKLYKNVFRNREKKKTCV